MLPAGAYAGNNANAFKGGFRLWSNTRVHLDAKKSAGN
jgi:hypothetical protein